MVAFSFLDAVAERTSNAAHSIDTRKIIESSIKSSLADWEGVLESERQFGSMIFSDTAEQSKLNRSLYAVYQHWAGDAEQVLRRAKDPANATGAIENLDALEHAFGRAQARLKMTPEMFDRAHEQIQQNQGIPMEELRNGLRARIRA